MRKRHVSGSYRFDSGALTRIALSASCWLVARLLSSGISLP
jgi:hypothetical protein